MLEEIIFSYKSIKLITPPNLVGFFYGENNLAKNLMEKIIYYIFIKKN
jgi:hypothetical protein